MSGSITSTETTTEISTVWIIDRATLDGFAADSSKKLRSPLFGQGRWQLFLQEKKDEQVQPHSITLCLQAKATVDDLLAATSKNAWIRAGSWVATFEVSSVDDSRTASFETSHEYNSKETRFGKKFFVNQAAFAAFYANSATIRIDCTLQNEGVLEAPRQRTSDGTGHIFFDSPEFADVVFTFQEDPAGERQIFASRAILQHRSDYFKHLFSSGFSEANQVVNIDIANLPRTAPGSRDQDEDDMAVFDVDVADDTRATKRRKLDEEEKLEPTSDPSFRSMIEIKVMDTCFLAYRAMLAHLHFSLFPFTALPSDYLVARQKALTEYETGSEATEPFTFPDRPKWLQDQFKSLKNQSSWRNVRPCSPHAIYRLAHRFDMQDLLDLVRIRIFRCLDVENAAYELFSPLSIVHEDVQNGIIDYMSKNWDQVKGTHAWKEVVDKIAAGELAHAAPVIKRVFELMQIAPK